jgi:hypothetical protein
VNERDAAKRDAREDERNRECKNVRIRRLEAVLRFYADPRSWEGNISPAGAEHGARARAVLSSRR